MITVCSSLATQLSSLTTARAELNDYQIVIFISIRFVQVSDGFNNRLHIYIYIYIYIVHIRFRLLFFILYSFLVDSVLGILCLPYRAELNPN